MDPKAINIEVRLKNKDGAVLAEYNRMEEGARGHLRGAIRTYIEFFKQPPTVGLTIKEDLWGCFARIDEVTFHSDEERLIIVADPFYEIR